MDIFQAFLLGILQGLTEFLPVSSSGHLALLQNFLGEVDVGFDVIVHLATLLAIIVFFFKDLLLIARDFFTFKTETENFKIAVYIIIASIPVAIIGFLFRNFIYASFSNLLVVSFGFFISGMFLFTASFANPKNKPSLWNTFLVGLSQTLALLPGLSRSGATVSTGILTGIKREKAIRFSFLLAIPALIGAGFLNFWDMKGMALNVIFTGFITAFFSGLLAIFLFLKYIKIKNLKYFAIYCWIMAIVSFWLYQIL